MPAITWIDYFHGYPLFQARVPDSGNGGGFTTEEREFAYCGLIRLFTDKEESARVEEGKTDNILDGKQARITLLSYGW